LATRHLSGFEKEFHEESTSLFIERSRFLLWAALVLYPTFWFLDLLIVPELAVRFLWIRGWVCIIYAAGLVAVYSPAARRLAQAAVLLGSMASVAGISLMASYMGGFASHYFAGNLIVLFVIGIFLPWEVPAVALLCALIIATYAGIELRVGGMTRAMIGPLFYLAGAAVFTCLAVLSARRTLRRDLSLRLQLARANEELKELDAAKSRFFANVTHELRTPLTLLLGPLDALRAEETDPARTQLLAAMSTNARRLLRQVDALLEGARLESGRLRLHPQEGDLGRLLTELATAAAPHAARRGLTLRTEGLETLPESVFDVEKVETIAANLLSNAVKFTPAGGHVTIRGATAGDRIAFEVEDDGPGIPDDQLEKVFERFHQVDAPHTRAEGGTGLGLALARELARLHGGEVTVRSPPGKGSIFRVELPLEAQVRVEQHRRKSRRKEDQLAQVRTETQAARAYAARRETLIADLELPSLTMAAPQGPQAPPGAPRVLLVEDNADLRTFVAHHLVHHYEVEAVGDAESGLEAARRDPPDLILADVMLPGMDGLELCRRVRDDAALAGVPIVLMTAKAGVDAVVEGLGVGADDYVIKPFVLRELEARIAAHLRAKEIERRLHEREGRLAAIGQMTSGLVHDLRNPLTQLKGSTDLAYFLALQGGELGTIVEELEIVRAGSDRLRRMIEEILDYARGGTPSLRLEKVTVRLFLDKVLNPLISDLKERGIEADIRSEISDGVQATLDPDRVQRVLENLVRNAREAVQTLKRDRRVWLSARLEGQSLALRVADNGPGISEEAARHLFKPFATDKKQGTGLGLVTARDLVNAHGGELRVETRAPEGGAAFTMVLPLEHPADLEAQVFVSGASRE
jgi:signal transduction histidine kinase